MKVYFQKIITALLLLFIFSLHTAFAGEKQGTDGCYAITNFEIFEDVDGVYDFDTISSPMFEDHFQRADKALYQAKTSGRNQVVFFYENFCVFTVDGNVKYHSCTNKFVDNDVKKCYYRHIYGNDAFTITVGASFVLFFII